MSHIYGGSAVWLDRWHAWFPWVPVKITDYPMFEVGEFHWRWLRVVERKRVYHVESGLWERDQFRDATKTRVLDVNSVMLAT